MTSPFQLRPTIGRAILAAVVGTIVSMLVVAAMEAIGHRIYPPPAGLDPRNPAAVRTIIAQMPAAAFALLVLGWVLGAGIGSFVAMQLSRTRNMWPGGAVGGMTLGATSINLFAIEHPVWVVIAALIGILLASLVGAKAGRMPAAGVASARAT